MKEKYYNLSLRPRSYFGCAIKVDFKKNPKIIDFAKQYEFEITREEGGKAFYKIYFPPYYFPDIIDNEKKLARNVLITKRRLEGKCYINKRNNLVVIKSKEKYFKPHRISKKKAEENVKVSEFLRRNDYLKDFTFIE